jgi:phosphate transport system permease protein
MLTLYSLLIVILVAIAFVIGRKRGSAFQAASAGQKGAVHSLPIYHGLFTATLTIIPMLIVLALYIGLQPSYVKSAALKAVPTASTVEAAKPAAQNSKGLQDLVLFRDVQLSATLLNQDKPLLREELKPAAVALNKANNLAGLALLALGFMSGVAGLFYALKRITPEFRSRNIFEKFVLAFLIICSGVALLTTVGIVFSVFFETLNFVSRYPIDQFLFGTVWSPSSLKLGALPLFAGTLMITLIAIALAGPIGLFAAIYMAEYASKPVRDFIKPILEVLAGIPTVVFGFFAALTIAPMFKGFGDWLDLTLGTQLGVASESALAAGLVMGVMIIPFVSSLSDDVITAVPRSLRDGSLALGATPSETIRRVVLPAALPGIVSAMMLAVSRAVGETMIVVMAAGLAGNLTWNPLQAVTTITVQIKTLLVGDQEFDSAKTLSAFALGFVLFVFTLILNIIALRIVRKYREQYD